MKKKWIKGYRIPILLSKKSFLVMRLTLLLTVMLSVNAWATGVAQEAKVSLRMEDASLEEIILELREQTGVRFFYSIDKIKSFTHLSVDAEEESLRDVLNRLLEGTGLTYTLLDDVVVIKDAVVQAQDSVRKSVTVRGFVYDEKEQPLPGVTVQVVGTSVGTATSERGWFSIDLPMLRGKLKFSFVGYQAQEFEFSEKVIDDTLRVYLKKEIQNMAEVVVTGYGNIAKGNYTGASTTVHAEDVIMAGVSSIDQMLQGVVPGMLVWNSTGQVGASPKIRIRGTSTLLGSQEPVWVVDGVIQRDPQPFLSDYNTQFSVSADDITQLAGNAISWLNPNDIETITVLKDASATAIYGSQAANGVIVITTKKANIGKVSITYSGDFSIGQRPRYGVYDLMNSAENMELSKEIYEERRKYPAGSTILPIGYRALREKMLKKEITLEEMNEKYKQMALTNTDWFDILFRNSFNHSHALGISGGSEKIQNRTSFGFTQEKGEAIGNDIVLFTATSNTTAKLWENLTINMSLKGSIREVDGFAYGVDPFGYAYNTSRVIPAYNEDGSLYYHEKQGSTSTAIEGLYIYKYNILNERANTGSENNTRTWGTTFDLQWNILPCLQYQGVFAYTSSSSDSKVYASERSWYITQLRGYEYESVPANGVEASGSRLPMGGVLQTDLTNTSSITVRNSLVYDKWFKERHRIVFQVGIETNSVKTKGEATQRYGYMPDRGETFTNPPATYLMNGIEGYEIDNSTFAQSQEQVVNRVQNELSEYTSFVYTYDNRYILNFSVRVDASNRFGQDKNKRFEPTWSIGGKWRIAEEKFIDKWWLNMLDLYASYGYQGNAVTTVSPYLIATDTYMMIYSKYGLSISSLPYPDLGWEKTKTYNVGLDASFLEGRLNFTFNYYRKRSYVLSSKDIPYENGMGNGVVGGSLMKNNGYDFVVNILPVKSTDFTWQLSLNTSVTHNSVEKNNRVNTVNDYLNGNCIVDGRPFSTFYSYEFDGLDPEYGQPLFKNMDIEYGEDPIDFLVESGKFTPDFSGGLSTSFKYKNWQLHALFAVQWGGYRRLPDLYPATAANSGLPYPEENVSRKLKNRWRKSGDEAYTNIPSLPGTGFETIDLPKTATSESYGQNRYVMYNNSDIRVANTDFIRCRSFSLSYDINEDWLKKIHLTRLSLKAGMTNPFMWVFDEKWDGLDPETGNWPTRRIASFSLSLMF